MVVRLNLKEKLRGSRWGRIYGVLLSHRSVPLHDRHLPENSPVVLVPLRIPDLLLPLLLLPVLGGGLLLANLPVPILLLLPPTDLFLGITIHHDELLLQKNLWRFNTR